MAAKKPVAKPKVKDKRTVSKEDPLADLGLDTETETTAQTATQTATDTKTKPVDEPAQTEGADASGDTAGNEEVEVGEIEFGFSEFIPTAKRKAEGSKYKFDALVAPQKKDGKTLYANFVVKLQPGVDADKLRRSVQSATTQANRQGSDEGKYFVSRTATKDGKFLGMIVYRTDDRPKK